MSSKKKQRREYYEEFKREAVRLANEEGMKSSKVERVLFKEIEIEYNRNRIHSTLNYQTPANFEQNFLNQNRLLVCPLS